MSNTTQIPHLKKTTNKVVIDSKEDGEEIDIGVIISVLSLLILTVAVVFIIIYFSRLKKK